MAWCVTVSFSMPVPNCMSLLCEKGMSLLVYVSGRGVIVGQLRQTTYHSGIRIIDTNIHVAQVGDMCNRHRNGHSRHELEEMWL